MSYIPPCEDLAPYLRQKLTQDKAHTWQNAPYIHERVRELLRAVEYAGVAELPAYTPVSYWCGGYSSMMNIDPATLQTHLLNVQLANQQAQINQRMIDELSACCTERYEWR